MLYNTTTVWTGLIFSRLLDAIQSDGCQLKNPVWHRIGLCEGLPFPKNVCPPHMLPTGGVRSKSFLLNLVVAPIWNIVIPHPTPLIYNRPNIFRKAIKSWLPHLLLPLEAIWVESCFGYFVMVQCHFYILYFIFMYCKCFYVIQWERMLFVFMLYAAQSHTDWIGWLCKSS